MNLFSRLFGRKRDRLDELLDDQQRSIENSLTSIFAPHDPELQRIAEERKGHISLKAVSDEYNRLISAKYGRK